MKSIGKYRRCVQYGKRLKPVKANNKMQWQHCNENVLSLRHSKFKARSKQDQANLARRC